MAPERGATGFDKGRDEKGIGGEAGEERALAVSVRTENRQL